MHPGPNLHGKDRNGAGGRGGEVPHKILIKVAGQGPTEAELLAEIPGGKGPTEAEIYGGYNEDAAAVSVQHPGKQSLNAVDISQKIDPHQRLEYSGRRVPQNALCTTHLLGQVNDCSLTHAVITKPSVLPTCCGFEPTVPSRMLWSEALCTSHTLWIPTCCGLKTTVPHACCGQRPSVLPTRCCLETTVPSRMQVKALSTPQRCGREIT